MAASPDIVSPYTSPGVIMHKRRLRHRRITGDDTESNLNDMMPTGFYPVNYFAALWLLKEGNMEKKDRGIMSIKHVIDRLLIDRKLL